MMITEPSINAVTVNTGLFAHGVGLTELLADNYMALMVIGFGVNRLRFEVEHSLGDVTNGTLDSPDNAIEPGIRYHVAVRKTMTGGTWTGALFINGAKVSELAAMTNYDGGTNPTGTSACFFGIGKGANPTQSQAYWIVDDVRFSDIARTDAEILESYRRGIGYVAPIPEEAEPSILSITASPVTRWTPVVARISDAEDIVITLEAGTNRFTIYDSTKPIDEQWSGFFADRSSIDLDDVVHTISILPNGGWWTSSFVLRFNDTVIIGGDNSFTLEA